MNIEFKTGMPDKDGWYLVKLIKGHVAGNKPFDVDFCQTDKNGTKGWNKWYPHNISHWAAITGLVDNPEQSLDNEHKTPPVSGLSNPGERSKLDGEEATL